MGNACSSGCASDGRQRGRKMYGKGRDLVIPSGNTYALVCAFNYEVAGNYNPAASGCSQLSGISDGEHFSDLCEASGAHLEVYYDQMQGRSQGFPDKAMIVNKIKEYSQTCGPDDVFVFFYAGHGTQGQQGMGDATEIDGTDEEMCFVDQQGNYTAFTDNEVAELLVEFDTETHILLVTDCCCSATVCDLSRPELAEHQVCHLAATKDSQFAQDLGDGGAFTSSLCETMERLVADADGDEDFSVAAVYNECFEDYSVQFDAQDFTYEKTEAVDWDAFRFPLVPPPGWSIHTVLDDQPQIGDGVLAHGGPAGYDQVVFEDVYVFDDGGLADYDQGQVVFEDVYVVA